MLACLPPAATQRAPRYTVPLPSLRGDSRVVRLGNPSRRAGTYARLGQARFEALVLARTLRAGVAGLLLTLLAPLGASAADRTAEGGIVVLATRAGERGIGAGTVIEKTANRVRIVTAAHVATFGTLQLRLPAGSPVPARLVAVIPGRDLAVIEADLSADDAASLAPARLASPRVAEAVHVWGSGNDGPAYETGSVGAVGARLPDGAPRGRYALGAGIFNAGGELVGVYTGYFEVGSGRRLSIAELPAAALEVALNAGGNPDTRLAAVSVATVALRDGAAAEPGSR